MCEGWRNSFCYERQSVVQPRARLQCGRSWKCGEHADERFQNQLVHDEAELGTELGTQAEAEGTVHIVPGDAWQWKSDDCQQRGPSKLELPTNF